LHCTNIAQIKAWNKIWRIVLVQYRLKMLVNSVNFNNSVGTIVAVLKSTREARLIRQVPAS